MQHTLNQYVETGLRTNGGLELIVRNQAEIPLKFTDKVPFLADLSVSKTHFTDKRPFLTILSVIDIFQAGHLRTKRPFSLMCP